MEPEKQDQPSGKELIVAYLKGDPSAIVAYGKICYALSLFKDTPEETKIKFLTQLCEMGEYLDDKCSQLVQALTKVPWSSIPSSFRSNYQRLLLETALHCTNNVDFVYEACVRNFQPEPDREYSDDEMDAQLKLSHSLISQILRCIPISAKVLSKKLENKFPHHMLETKGYAWHFRNLILIGEYATQLRPIIWDLLIQRLLILDSYTSSKKISTDSDDLDDEQNIFELDEMKDDQPWNTDEVSNQLKSLDECMLSVFQYISTKMGQPVEDAPWLRVGASNDLLELFSSPFDMHLLMTPNATVVPFIWLYLCNFDPKYPTRFLDNIWHRITQPQRAQSDLKRSQNAASFLAAFLARSTYIDADESFEWLERICDWLLAYVDNQNEYSSAFVQPGAFRHGTFYALCQVFFIVFCFRYKRISANKEKWDLLCRWNLSRIVNSHLAPLKYVSRSVAICFSTIARSLQLVYCSYQLASRQWEPPQQTVLEFSFPLNSYGLPQTSSFVSPLLRRFAPLAEDVELLREEFAKDKATKEIYQMNKISEDGDESGLAFLDEADEPMLLGSPICTISGFPASLESAILPSNLCVSYDPIGKAFDYNQTVHFNKKSGMR